MAVMEVTYKTVGEVIAERYTTPPLVTDEFVGFGLVTDDYCLEVVLSLFDEEMDPVDETEEEEIPTRQVLKIWMWFCHPDKNRIDMSHLGLSQLLELCWRLQGNLDWGTIVPLQHEDGSIEISLCMSTNISHRDLSMAAADDNNSVFLQSLERLSVECDRLSEVLLGVVHEDIKTIAEAMLLLTEPHGEA